MIFVLHNMFGLMLNVSLGAAIDSVKLALCITVVTVWVAVKTPLVEVFAPSGICSQLAAWLIESTKRD